MCDSFVGCVNSDDYEELVLGWRTCSPIYNLRYKLMNALQNFLQDLKITHSEMVHLQCYIYPNVETVEWEKGDFPPTKTGIYEDTYKKVCSDLNNAVSVDNIRPQLMEFLSRLLHDLQLSHEEILALPLRVKIARQRSMGAKERAKTCALAALQKTVVLWSDVQIHLHRTRHFNLDISLLDYAEYLMEQEGLTSIRSAILKERYYIVQELCARENSRDSRMD